MSVMTDERVFDCEHVTEADAPQWMHDQARKHVSDMVALQLRDKGLTPLDSVVVTEEPFTLSEDGHDLSALPGRGDRGL